MDDMPLDHTTWLRFIFRYNQSTKLLRLLRGPHWQLKALTHCIEALATSGQYPDSAHDIASLEIRSLIADQRPHYQHLVDKALNWEQCSTHHHLLALDHPSYPDPLRQIVDAPALLYAKGTLKALDLPQLAIVGARKASRAARQHAFDISEQLAGVHVGVTSGLALGIDAAAHQGALQGKGTTIAVSATEPSQIYPKQHHRLAERILEEDGLILTEYAIGSLLRPWHFPRRNRLISGLSLGVLVAEASLPSGTLTTATHALQQGKEVMAIPGSLNNPQSRGCHHLIKQGAALVENIHDVLDVIKPLLVNSCDDYRDLATKSNSVQSLQVSSDAKKPAARRAVELTPVQEKLLAYLAVEEPTLDDLMSFNLSENLGYTVSELTSTLTLLEVQGFITTSHGSRYARC